YPNPSEGQFTVEVALGQSELLGIELWNKLGQRLSVIREPSVVLAGTYRVPVNAPVAGMYLVRLQVGDRVNWFKLVVTQ
ncbi:MAG: T9SS type A sorting domain-containing protein, partial [Chitinophagales bacterium]|nr:T9SS type A sorting domain-containing protein [Chitinophagales bacterium]